MELKSFIGEMTAAPGLPGYEREVAQLFCREMEALGARTDIDAMSNATACLGEGAPRIMVTAHLDEIGLIVTEILEDGALRFTRMGGVDPRILPGSRVHVYAGGGAAITGVIGAKPPHLLTAADRKKNLELKDMYIDLGMSAERVRELVRVGDLVTLSGPLTELAGDNLASKTMDDRACVAVMCEAARLLGDVKLAGEVCFVAAAQEEVGSRGAQTAAHRLAPDLAIAIDVTHGTMPDCRPQEIYPLDSVVMSIGPNIHPMMHARMMDTARRNGIKVLESVCGGVTSTDAAATQVAREGIPTLLIELPLKYMHTTVETLNLNTLRETARLLACFVRDTLADWGNIQWQ